MTRGIRRRFSVVLGAWVIVAATSASAQTIGTFRWQFAPFCNTVTLTVEQHGATYRLEGYDDQCGGPIRASATGLAHLNPNGTVGLSVRIVRPGGFSIDTTASLTLPALTGTWADSYGNSGTFAFSPPTPAAGAPRLITIRGNYAIDYYSAAPCGFTFPCGITGASAISFGVTLPSAPIPHLVALDQPPTATCPGTAANPQAAPGHLCVYTGATNFRAHVLCIASGAYACDATDKTGAAVVVLQQQPGSGPVRIYHAGVWAVTVP